MSNNMTVDEAAAELLISRRTLDRLASRGEGPPRYRVGRRIIYRRADVEAYLEEQVRETAQ